MGSSARRCAPSCWRAPPRLEGAPRQQLHEQGYFPGFCSGAQHGNRPDDENASSDIGRPAWRSARASACPRLNPGAAPARSRRENRVPTETPSVRHRRHDRGRPQNPDARDGFNPLARLVRAMLRLDPLFDCPNHRLHRLKLCRQHDDARPRIDRQARLPSSATIASNSFTPHRPSPHDAELARCAARH